MKHFLFIALSGFILSCSGNQTNAKQEPETPTTANTSVPEETPTKFGLSSDVILKINQQMGLGTLLPWKNDAGPGEEPYWFTTLEYEVEDPNLNLENLNNHIELSIGSKGKTGRYVEYLIIDVRFMNPKDKARAKKLFLEKVTQMSVLIEIPIPEEIMTALKKETNLKQKIGDFEYQIEEFGATKRALALTIR